MRKCRNREIGGWNCELGGRNRETREIGIWFLLLREPSLFPEKLVTRGTCHTGTRKRWEMFFPPLVLYIYIHIFFGGGGLKGGVSLEATSVSEFKRPFLSMPLPPNVTPGNTQMNPNETKVPQSAYLVLFDHAPRRNGKSELQLGKGNKGELEGAKATEVEKDPVCYRRTIRKTTRLLHYSTGNEGRSKQHHDYQ